MPGEIEFKFKGPHDSPGYLLGQLTQLWQRRQRRVLDPLNLTPTQFVILAALGWLARGQAAVTQTAIANQSNTDTMMVSKVLRTLESKRYVSRREHPEDTRAKVIELTGEGAKLLQQALHIVEDTDLDFFSVLGEELPAFNRTMVRLLDRNRE